MIPIRVETEAGIRTLAETTAEGFKNNPAFLIWADKEETRKRILTDFFYIILPDLIKGGMAFTTSEAYEGICGFWTKKNGITFRQKMKMLKLIRHFSISRIFKLAKQYAGIKRAEDFVKEEDDYLFVFMVVVQEGHRGQGHMRKIMEFLLKEARQRELTCILETDSERNNQIYQHFGMKSVSEQEIHTGLTYYVLKY